MFTEKSLMFIYCATPLHMGAGISLGAIDNPIQREKHTNHPMMIGSGIKGAIRHHLVSKNAGEKDKIIKIFGPEPENSREESFAGAISFSDAQIVLFPVRSLKNSFVYATCPTALARLKRMSKITGKDVDWDAPELNNDSGCYINKDNKVVATLKDEENDNKSKSAVVLESYIFEPIIDEDAVSKIFNWLSKHINCSSDYFTKKIKNDTVILSDNIFNYFVQNSTLVEPHVRINDETGTAEDGGLFYTENLPPESVLASITMASITHKRDNAGGMQAKTVIEYLKNELKNEIVQMGGDATTGRGQVILNFI